MKLKMNGKMDANFSTFKSKNPFLGVSEWNVVCPVFPSGKNVNLRDKPNLGP